MDPRKLTKNSIAYIITDGILVLMMIVDICKGELTARDMYYSLVVSVIVGVPIIALIKRQIRNRRRR